jgi:hypothetical protein
MEWWIYLWHVWKLVDTDIYMYIKDR